MLHNTKQIHRKPEAKMPHKREEGTVAIETRGKVKRKAQYPEEGKRQGVLDRMYHNEKGCWMYLTMLKNSTNSQSL